VQGEAVALVEGLDSFGGADDGVKVDTAVLVAVRDAHGRRRGLPVMCDVHVARLPRLGRVQGFQDEEPAAGQEPAEVAGPDIADGSVHAEQHVDAGPWEWHLSRCVSMSGTCGPSLVRAAVSICGLASTPIRVELEP
jgi:hypothetical protein